MNIFVLMSVSNKERLTKYSLLHSSSIGPIGPNALQVPNSKPSENEEKNGETFVPKNLQMVQKIKKKDSALYFFG